MKNKILGIFVVAFLLFGCSKTELTENSVTETPMMRSCASMEVLNAQLAADPAMAERMNAIERFTNDAIASGKAFRLVNGVIEIPVVFNVIYRTSSENVSDARLQSQIDVLNADFNASNSDINKVPSQFSGSVANVGIRFKLEKVVRRQSNKTKWALNDAMKFASKGGIDATNPALNLNIWVVNSMGGYLGYAQFPGGPSATDGVVLAQRYVGLSGSLGGPYNLGRTATHEVGHYLNLRHIWGDANCGNDQVSDTPLANGPNYGCPTFPHVGTCSSTPEMTMNYMDYTDDACMYMFTNGQKARALAVFASGGPRAAMAQ